MALGILEAGDGHVPGTVYTKDEEQRLADLLDKDATLHRTKDGKTILVPQPNIEDPNDPLMWPLWQRDMILGILCFVSVVATTATPLLAANTVTVAILGFGVGVLQGAQLTAYHLAGASVGAFFAVPFARVFGKRGLFLFSTLLMIASSVWGGQTRESRDYGQMAWARALQGVAVAPFESLVNACVGDLYYVHERGPRMAITNVCLFAGAFMTPVIVGVTSARIGWEWSFYNLAIIEAFGFVLLFFFVPEMTYNRPAHLNTDLTAQRLVTDSHSPHPSSSDGKPAEKIVTVAVPKKTFLQQLSPFDGIKTRDNFVKLILRAFPLFFQPAVLWACLMTGVIIGWTAMVGVIISLIFIPLGFNEERTGYVYSAAVVGSIIALVFAGVFSELTTNFLVRRNHGKYEPEFRLMLVIPTLILGTVGLFGFGTTANDILRYGYISVGVFLGFIIMCMVTGTIAASHYILDAYRDISVEAFTCTIIFKNIFSFILTWYSIDWVVSRQNGAAVLFYIFGGIEIAICLLAIPLYVFGKRIRAFFHTYDILKICRLR